MINYDSLTLKAQTQELKQLFLDGKIQKIQQPSRKELIISIKGKTGVYKFYVSINPDDFHIAVMSEESAERRMLEIPYSPPMFCMLLRKHIEGARVLDIKNIDGERILEFHLGGISQIGDETRFVLSFELMGKHSNIVLYNQKTYEILGCAHNVGEEKSSVRPLFGGLTYSYPPVQNKISLLTISEEDFIKKLLSLDRDMKEWLNLNCSNISLSLAAEIVQHLKLEDKTVYSKDEISSLFKLLQEVLFVKNVKPSCSKDLSTFSLFSFSDEESIYFESVNKMVDFYFSLNQFNKKFNLKKKSLERVVQKELKKLTGSLSKLKSEKELLRKAEFYKEKADTLMANLYSVSDYSSSILLNSVYSGESLKIELDSTLSLAQNAQKYFKLYNKYKSTNKSQDVFKNEVYAQVSYLETVKNSLLFISSYDELLETEEELTSYGIIKLSENNQKKKQQKKEIKLEKFEEEGFEVYLGKNNKQNDYIVSKFSRADDIWLHAQEMPGSHVLIRVLNNKEVPNSVLDFASKLAAKYSAGYQSSKVPVVYVQRKFLKKPPASPLGFVTFTNEKTIIVKNEN